LIDILSKKEKRRQKRWRNSAARLMRRRDHLKEMLDGPNQDIDRLILAVRANRGQMPAELIKRFGLNDKLAKVAKVERLITFPFKALPPLPYKAW